MRIARSTPAQNPRGAAISRSIFRRGDTVSMTVIGHVLMRSLVAGEPASYDAIDNCQKGMPDGCLVQGTLAGRQVCARRQQRRHRSEEHTSELQSLMRISYAVFCLKKKPK